MYGADVTAGARVSLCAEIRRGIDNLMSPRPMFCSLVSGDMYAAASDAGGEV